MHLTATKNRLTPFFFGELRELRALGELDFWTIGQTFTEEVADFHGGYFFGKDNVCRYRMV